MGKARSQSLTTALAGVSAFAIVLLAMPDTGVRNSPIGVATAQSDVSADHDEAAEAVYRQAVDDVTTADASDDIQERLLLLREAHAALDRIVQDYPNTGTAIEIQREAPPGTLAFNTLRQSLSDAEHALVCRNNEAVCGLFSDAQSVVARIFDPDHRFDALAFLTRAQADVGLYTASLRTSAGITDDEERSEVVGEVALIQAEAGLFADARRTAAAIPHHNIKMETFDDLVQVMVEAGGMDEARLAVRQALAGHDALEQPANPVAMYHLANALMAVGFHKRGRATLADAAARAIEFYNGLGRVAAFRHIVAAQAEAGLFPDALEALGRLVEVDPSPAAGFMGYIAGAQMEAGLTEAGQRSFAEALRVAQTVRDGEDRAYALRRIATELAAVGLFEAALETAAQIGDDRVRADCLLYVAGYQVEAGQREEGRRTLADARTAASAHHRETGRGNDELIEIAAYQIDIGVLGDAIGTIGDLDPGRSAVRLMAEVAANQMEAGQTEAGLRTFADTLGLAQRITRPHDLALAMSEIAQRMAEHGMEDEARRLFTQSIDLIEVLPREAPRNNTFGLVVSDLVLLGWLSEALRVTELMTDARIASRSRREAYVAREFAEAGDFAQAMTVAARIASSHERGVALTRIATVYADAGDAEQSIRVLGDAAAVLSIEVDPYRSSREALVRGYAWVAAALLAPE